MPSRNCPGHLETVQIIWNLSRPSGNFPDHLETFQAIWKLSRPPENCPDHLKTFQTIWKLSRPSGRFPDHPEAFQNIRPSVKAGWEFSSIFKNFPGFQFGPLSMLLWSNETVHCNSVLHCNYLKVLCRKLIYAHLSRIVSNKILRVFSPGKFLQKKSATWKVFVFSAPAHRPGSHQQSHCLLLGFQMHVWGFPENRSIEGKVFLPFWKGRININHTTGKLLIFFWSLVYFETKLPSRTAWYWLSCSWCFLPMDP